VECLDKVVLMCRRCVDTVVVAVIHYDWKAVTVDIVAVGEPALLYAVRKGLVVPSFCSSVGMMSGLVVLSSLSTDTCTRAYFTSGLSFSVPVLGSENF
jgi:hypothetical protein